MKNIQSGAFSSSSGKNIQVDVNMGIVYPPKMHHSKIIGTEQAKYEYSSIDKRLFAFCNNTGQSNVDIEGRAVSFIEIFG